MKSDPLTWQEYDPEGKTPPLALGPLGPGAEAPASVVFLATPRARRDGWAGRAASSLAEAWARGGTPVLLADLDVRRPELHEVLGEENGEGISDLLLWGASPERVARERIEGALSFAPAGTVVADPEKVFSHPGWAEVRARIHRAGRSLVLFVPQDEPGAVLLARHADSVVVLATAGEQEVVVSGLSELRIDAVLGPGTVRGSDGEGAGELPEEGVPRRGSGTEPGRVATARPGAEGAAGRNSSWIPPLEGSGEPDEASDTRPRAKKRKNGEPRRLLPWLLLFLLVLVGGVLAAGWLGMLTIPGLTPPPEGAGLAWTFLRVAGVVPGEAVE